MSLSTVPLICVWVCLIVACIRGDSELVLRQATTTRFGRISVPPGWRSQSQSEPEPDDQSIENSWHP